MGRVGDWDERSIDRIYGLEPVYEPGATNEDATLMDFVSVDCPYCGETFSTAVDLSAGAFSYVEDCQVCCQPIDLSARFDENGLFIGVQAARAG